MNFYEPTWGRHKARTRPAIGNHEYNTDRGAGYFSYFGDSAGDPLQGWYSYDLGSWHIIVLNSNCSAVGGCGQGSPQGQWLRNDLQAHPSQCTLAYFHTPRFSSGQKHGNDLNTRDFWQVLYEHGAELVMGGNDHNYERFGKQTPDGIADPTDGIRQFVVGTGGRFLRPGLQHAGAEQRGARQLDVRDPGAGADGRGATRGSSSPRPPAASPTRAPPPATSSRAKVGFAWAASRPRDGGDPRNAERRAHRAADHRLGTAHSVLEAGPRDSAEAVVFVHGNPGSSRDWEDLVTRTGAFARAVAWDMPGFGRADKPHDFEFAVPGYARFLGEALSSLGVERAHLVLHDLGGPWGLEWATDHAGSRRQRGPGEHGRVRRVSLAHPGPHLADTGARRGLHGDSDRPMFRTADQPRPEAQAAARVSGLDVRQLRPAHAPDRAEALPRRGQPWPSARRQTETLRPHDLPALVLWGGRDPYLGARSGRAAEAGVPERTAGGAAGQWPLAFHRRPGRGRVARGAVPARADGAPKEE